MKSDYTINVTRYYYGPTKRTMKHTCESGCTWTGTRAAARTEIERCDNQPYVCAHNEYSRPTMTISWSG